MLTSKGAGKLIFEFLFCIAVICGVSWVQITVAADSSATDQQGKESAADISNRVLAEISAIQIDIDRAQSSFGPFHAELLEPLQRMVSLQIGLENYQEVDRLLDRYLQINRINAGPSTLAQVPALVEQISNDIRQEDWQSINDRFQFITWLYAQHSNFDTVDLLSLLDEFAAWNLTAVYIDIPELRADHFMAYRAVLENALDFAEREYGDESTLLVPWLYRAALMEYRGITMQRTGDELRVGPGAGSLDDALLMIRRIRAIVNQYDNAEAKAMAMVYEADFIKLANELGRNKYYGSSDDLYRQAIAGFRAGGVAEEKISAFFKQPVILPMNRFYAFIDSATQEQKPVDIQSKPGITLDWDIEQAMEFTAWNESLPFARRPEKTSLFAGLSTELQSVLLQFSIDKHGDAKNADAIHSIPATAGPRAYARNAVDQFTFRPNPTASRWRSERRSVNLLYSYTP